MASFDHQILRQVASLGLERPDEIVINHGAALVIRELREEHESGDIDFTTSLEHIKFLREELGWLAVRKVVGAKRDDTPMEIVATRDLNFRFDVHRWTFSIPRYKKTGRGRIYLPEQIARSEQDSTTGIWVASPELVRETKLDTGRPKDIADIELIDNFL